MFKKLITLLCILNALILPSLASCWNAGPTTYFYSPNKTIMAENSSDSDITIQNEKFWQRNLMYFNKYSPLFMLSNTELYDLIPKEIPVNSNLKINDASLDKKINSAILSKNYSLAISMLNDIILQEPYNAYAFYLKGEVYSKQKNLDEAMKSYVQALRINPLSTQCYLSIAKILEPTNKQLAQKYYEKAKME